LFGLKKEGVPVVRKYRLIHYYWIIYRLSGSL